MNFTFNHETGKALDKMFTGAAGVYPGGRKKTNKQTNITWDRCTAIFNVADLQNESRTRVGVVFTGIGTGLEKMLYKHFLSRCIVCFNK